MTRKVMKKVKIKGNRRIDVEFTLDGFVILEKQS